MIRQFILCTGLVLATACSNSSTPATPTPTPTPTPAAAVAVTIPVNARTLGTGAYVPDPVTVPVGGTVTWTNTDSIAHTTTSTDPLATFDSGLIAAGGKFSVTLQNKGTFSYKCTIHAGMAGTIVVQ
jgi:plastocyanin